MRVTRLKGICRTCVLLLGGIALLLLLTVGGLNLLKPVIYGDYYAIKEDVCQNPGLSDGFVCQGICVLEEQERILVSGYMMDQGPSRIYVTDAENRSYFVSLVYGSGKDFTGHSGGIAVCGEFLYIPGGGRVYAIPLDSVLEAENGDRVAIRKIIPVENEASFVYADESHVYVGEYHDGKRHFTDHPRETAEGMHYAIVSRYPKEELEAYHKTERPTVTPDRIYSVRDNVQGICFTDEGGVVLSTSYGIADTVYYLYCGEDIVASGETADGVPIYDLCGEVARIKGPAMGEGLDFSNGRAYTLSESASDRYVFGKFFFANKIVALNFDWKNYG